MLFMDFGAYRHRGCPQFRGVLLEELHYNYTIGFYFDNFCISHLGNLVQECFSHHYIFIHESVTVKMYSTF